MWVCFLKLSIYSIHFYKHRSDPQCHVIKAYINSIPAAFLLVIRGCGAQTLGAFDKWKRGRERTVLNFRSGTCDFLIHFFFFLNCGWFILPFLCFMNIPLYFLHRKVDCHFYLLYFQRAEDSKKRRWTYITLFRFPVPFATFSRMFFFFNIHDATVSPFFQVDCSYYVLLLGFTINVILSVTCNYNCCFDITCTYYCFFFFL